MPSNGAFTDQDIDKPQQKGKFTDSDIDSSVNTVSGGDVKTQGAPEPGGFNIPIAPMPKGFEHPTPVGGQVDESQHPDNPIYKELGHQDEIKNRAAGVQNKSITPVTNAVSGMDPIGTTGAIAGSRLLGIAGKHAAPHIGLSPETGETAGGLIGGVVGGHLAGGVAPGTPKPAGVIGRAIAPEVAPGMGEEATNNMQEDIQARRGTEKMFKAAAPSASDLDFRERLSQAAPDLSQLAKEKPLRSGGGIINPDFRVRELVSNLNDYMDNLWKQEYAPQIKNAADAPAPLDQLKQSMKQTISQIDREKQPGLVASLEDELMRMPERETVGQLENRRVQLSDKLNRYYKANPAEQVAMENQNFNVAATKAEYEATLDVLDRTLKLNGEAGGMGPRGRYGNLAEVRSYIAKQMNPTEQATMMQHLAQIVLRRGPERLITGALANPSAGRQVASGMELLGRSELAPPITPGQTEPFPRPKQLSERVSPHEMPMSTAGGPLNGGTPPTAEGTTATRKGLILPEKASKSGMDVMQRGPEGKGGPDTTISHKIITPAPHPYQEAGLPREQIPAPPNQGGITRREPGDKPIFIEGKPTTNIEDTQESTNKALRVLRDPNASAADKVKARARLRFMPSAQEKQAPTPTPSKWGRFGRKNIGRPVIR